MILNKKEYKEAVNKIVISDALREKIIQNSSEKNTHIYKRNNIYKQFQRAAGIAACFAICMVSYHAVTNDYHLPADVIMTTPSPSVRTPDSATDSNTEDNAIASATADIAPVQNHTNTSDEQNSPNNTNHAMPSVNPSAHDTTDSAVNENPAVNPDASPSIADTNQDVQSNLSDTEQIEPEDTFPPVLSAAPAAGDPAPIENIGDSESAGGVCAGYPGENLSAIAEIEQELGYTIKIPHYVPDDYKTDSLSAPFGAFAQITYTNETDTLYYRTAKGSEDISGDYNDYSEIETVVIHDNDVTIKGNDDLYHNASWVSGDEAFSLYSDTGMEKDTMIDIIKSVD